MKFFRIFRAIINLVEKIVTIFKSNPAQPEVELPADNIEPPTIEPEPAQMPEIKTAHFHQSEFLRKNTELPDEYANNLLILMKQLETIRRSFGGKAIKINDGFRTPEQNANTQNSVQNSQHLYAKAADFTIKGMHPTIVYEGIIKLIQSGDIIDGGVGLYDNHTHYDTGPSRRWDERKKPT